MLSVPLFKCSLPVANNFQNLKVMLRLVIRIISSCIIIIDENSNNNFYPAFHIQRGAPRQLATCKSKIKMYHVLKTIIPIQISKITVPYLNKSKKEEEIATIALSSKKSN